MKNKLIGAIGLARRANKVVYGEVMYSKFKKNEIYLVIIGDDISEKSLLRLKKKINFYRLNHIVIKNSELSSSIGKEGIKAIGITDENFKKFILNIVGEGGNNGKNS